MIRSACVDTGGRAWDREARAALQLADVIAEDLERRHSPEPVELGPTARVGLLTVFHDRSGFGNVQAHIAASQDLGALYLGLRRFVLDAA